MNDQTRQSVVALLANAAQLIGTATEIIAGQQSPEEIVLREGPQSPETCKHKNKQTFQGAGGAPERTVCVDCGKEF